MDIKGVLLQWFINFLIKSLQAEQLKTKNMWNKKLAEELHKNLIENLINETTLTFFRQNLGCWTYWYAINNKI